LYRRAGSRNVYDDFRLGNRDRYNVYGRYIEHRDGDLVPRQLYAGNTWAVALADNHSVALTNAHTGIGLRV
jgi:hypothetical protein